MNKERLTTRILSESKYFEIMQLYHDRAELRQQLLIVENNIKNFEDKNK